jgi:hypothetical protein
MVKISYLTMRRDIRPKEGEDGLVFDKGTRDFLKEKRRKTLWIILKPYFL